MNSLVNIVGLKKIPGVAARCCWIFAALGMLWVAEAWAAPPRQVDATYRLSKAGQPFGTAKETFRRDGEHYRLESVSRATGLFALFVKGTIRLVSVGDVGPSGLLPTHFEHQRGNDPDKAVYADFDWQKHLVALRYDGKSESEELPPGCQDRLSLLYQFLFKPPRGAEIEVAMSNGRQVGRYRYRVVGEEALTTPAGRFETVHLSKMEAGRGDGVEIWLAKNRGYFPVRVSFEEKDGSFLEQVVESLSMGD
ncbi:MAG: DUF3108 domain-containing protein [Sulfuricella sp.]|nr:DUF3108 domain-containing protein [Sulfuricella sp.]